VSQVLFFDYLKGNDHIEGINRLLVQSGFIDAIPDEGSVAIKLHMGELGNIRYLRPFFVSSVVRLVKEKGGKPFLFDTVASYPGSRDTKRKYLSTAATNGFSKGSIGAPIVIADDSDKQVVVKIDDPVDGCQLDEVKIPAVLLDADCIIALSHVKGHELAGFGGAVKNLAMGCVSTETKRLQHDVARPQFNQEACDLCGQCVDECPTGAIAVFDGLSRDEVKCISCGTCLSCCSSQGWVWPAGSKELLQVYMAHATAAFLGAYKGNIGYMNFVQDIVPYCDCMEVSGQPIVPDIGVLFSDDAVSVDKASLDLIDLSPIIPHTVSFGPPDVLGQMHNTNSLVQLNTAEKLKVGGVHYKMDSI
jgi:uncharacterized protein